MAVALRPAWFEGGAEAGDGSQWAIGDALYDENPRRRLTAGDYAMLRLWRAFRGGELGGSSHLPEDVLAQPAILLEAFDWMEAQFARLKKEWGDG